MSTDRGESSKQASKRAKKDRAAINATLIDDSDHESVSISSDDSNNSSTFSSPTCQSSSPPKKKKRGPAKINFIPPVDGKCLKVRFNERGQPVGKYSNRLVSFIGCLVRQMVPITLSTWHKVDNGTRERLCICVKQQFRIADCHMKMVLMLMGRLWRNYKAVLAKKIRDLAKNKDVDKHIKEFMDLKPKNIKSDKQWEKFVKEKNSSNFQKLSKRFQNMRDKQKMTHTTGRGGLARLEDKMRKEKLGQLVSRVDVWIRGHSRKNGEPINEDVAETLKKIKKHKPTSSGSSGSIIDDAIGAVFGRERNGQVRGLGYGATPSRVALQEHNKSYHAHLEKELRDLKEKFAEFQTRCFQQMLNLKEQSERKENQEQDIESKTQNSEDTSMSHLTSVTSRCKITNIENSSCKLLDWMGTGKVVGEGKVASRDPMSKVHHIPLGPDHWKIAVAHAIVEDTLLIRPTQEFQILGHAVGSFIAWPKSYIVLDEI